MTPSSDHATRTPGAITRRGFAWMLFVLLLPIMQASAARDCDVCPGPPESKPAPPAVDSTETGACDVCPKPENHDAAGAPSPSGKRLRDCADCPELVAIPVGSPASANAPGFALSTADITFSSPVWSIGRFLIALAIPSAFLLLVTTG